MTEIIHGYEIGGEFRQIGGGKCLWTFCYDTAGQKLFIKQYLSPKYPLHNTASAVSVKQLQVCQVFENRQQTLMRMLKKLPRASSHLVTPIDFFRESASYYKVTPWIEREPLTRYQVSRLSAENTFSIMLTMLDALSILHSIRQVHGDVKFDNSFYQRSEKSYVGNLFDFDDCFPFGNPPGSKVLSCDMQYMPPETLRYVTEKDPETAKKLGVRLDGRSDIFSLGLLFHEYWTGEMPEFARARFGSPAAAVAAGEPLRIGGPYMPRGVYALIKSMLIFEPDKPDKRPDVWKVQRIVQDLQKAQPKTRVEGKVLGRLKPNVV